MGSDHPTIDSTATASPPWRTSVQGSVDTPLHLIIVWASTPERVGEVAALDTTTVLGRGPARADDPAPRLRFVQQRPGENIPTAILKPQRLSRLQLHIVPQGKSQVLVESVGQSKMLVNGQALRSSTVTSGDVIALVDAITFLVEPRPKLLALPSALSQYEPFPFGGPDQFGMVGESQYAWQLRAQCASLATSANPVLITGNSGAGKEVVARAIHGLSQAAGKLVSRNAATFPTSLTDAELFGNIKNYPNPGSPERPGIIGAAHGGTLFLDEVGELPSEQQAHLLRFLDDGEYQMLGDAKVRRANVRFVAATNRDPAELKHDFLARFTHRIHVEGPSARRSDLPFFVNEIVGRAASRDAEYKRFMSGAAEGKAPAAKVHPELMQQLLIADYEFGYRDLQRIVTLALQHSDGDFLSESPPVTAALNIASPPGPDPDGDAIKDALEKTQGNVTQAARALGLSSRYALYRLMRQHGIRTG